MVGWVETLISRKVDVHIIANRREFSENHDRVKPIILPSNLCNIPRILHIPRNWRMKLSSPKISNIRSELQKVEPNRIVLRFELDVTSVKNLISARLSGVPVYIYTQWPVIDMPIIKKMIMLFLVRLLRMPGFSPVYQYGKSVNDFERTGNRNKIDFKGDMNNRSQLNSLIKWMPFTLPESYTTIVTDIGKKQKESKFQFVTIGKFISRKNHRMMIETFCRNQNFMKSDSELIIIGECTTVEHESLYKDLVRILQVYGASDKIRILRNLSHEKVQEFLRQSEVFLLQSLDEPASISVLEAMGNASLLILNPASGTADYAGIDFGSLASTSEVELDQCINKVLEDKSFVERIQTRNAQTYQEFFSNRVVGDQFYRFLFENHDETCPRK
jgi:glycosyltransferase involved in cell wall biosynthesis